MEIVAREERSERKKGTFGRGEDKQERPSEKNEGKRGSQFRITHFYSELEVDEGSFGLV